MKVPFFSFTQAPESLRKSWVDAFASSVSESTFIGGNSVAEFEKSWANFTQSKFAIGVSNGLDGLEVALKASGIGKGDNVAVPSHTFIATYLAVHNVGATPVAIDVDQNGLMDLSILFKHPSKFDAVIPVHMHGSMVDMQRLHSWTSELRIPIIEDASQAHGANSNGMPPGSFSDSAVFSLYPTKNLGALGDAGVVVTNSQIVAEKVRISINYGSSLESKYIHDSLGYNRRLDSIQARILSVNLAELNNWNARRQEIANFYIESFNDSNIEIMQVNCDSVRHHFCLIVENRKKLVSYLSEAGIGTEIHYPKLAADEYAHLTNSELGNFPNGRMLASKILSLPISAWHTDSQVEYVVKNVHEFIRLNR